MGGLPTPRVPSEIKDGIVTTKDGRIVDPEFRAGAQKCLEIAMRELPELIILQSRSPSCGVKQRYDGSFTGTLTDGPGVTAELLIQHGFHVMDVDDLRTDDKNRNLGKLIMNFKTNAAKTWLEDDTGKQIALLEHPEVRPGVVCMVHTEVDPSLGGQGIAGKITKAVADNLRAEGRKAELTCSYSIRWFSKHPEYEDVLVDPQMEKRKAEELAGPACGIKRGF